jgi:L-asparaginase II
MVDLSHSDAPVVAHLVRHDRVESVHHGIGVVVDQSGREIHRVGRPETLVYPRSALKPIQALTLLECGVSLNPEEIALASASHLGSARHREAVTRFLHNHQLSDELLQCPVDWPLGEAEKEQMIASGQSEKTRVAMNCSGKHAGFLACCQHMGWSLDDYLDFTHPLQVKIRERIESLAGETVSHSTPDGCGAPLHQITLGGLAKAISGVVSGDTVESQAYLSAIAAHSWAIAGEGHANTLTIDALGGVAKIGAEGLVVIGLPGKATVAVKILDGSMRATTPFALSLLKKVGAVDDTVADHLIEQTSTKVYGGPAATGGLSIVV